MKSAPHQADRVEPVDARAVAHRFRVRQGVFRHDRIAADEGMTADAAELMHARSGTDGREVVDEDVSAERGVVAENRVVANVAVVRDVRVRHEHVAIADRRLPSASTRAAMDRDELAEDVVLADA